MNEGDHRGGRPRLLPRRRLIQGSLVATGTITAAAATRQADARWLAQIQPGGSATPELAGMASPEAVGGLTAAQTGTLRAAIDRLIPTDDLGPGATDSGVDTYIDHLLGGYGAALLPMYQVGLASLEDAAAPTGFANETANHRDAILTDLEAGNLAGAPEGFFALLLEHTRQGMFGDPVYGGNRNFAGWDLIQYPGIKLVWTSSDQALGAEVAPTHTSVSAYGGEGAQ